MRRLAIYVPLLIIAAVIGAMLARQLHPRVTQPQLGSGTWLPEPRPLPEVSLLDHEGRPLNAASLRGRPSLVFFGFTHCPDVCPTTLALFAQLTRAPAIPGLRAVFVSVDPQRDDPASLRRYLSAFGADITGVTGEPAQLQKLMQGMGTASLRRELPGGDYSMDHSATVYLLDRQARIAAIFTPPLSRQSMDADLKIAAAAFAAGDAT